MVVDFCVVLDSLTDVRSRVFAQDASDMIAAIIMMVFVINTDILND